MGYPTVGLPCHNIEVVEYLIKPTIAVKIFKSANFPGCLNMKRRLTLPSHISFKKIIFIQNENSNALSLVDKNHLISTAWISSGA